MYNEAINNHYGHENLGEKILTALQNAGKNIDSLTHEDLSTFDQFHFGGIAATRTVAREAGLQPGWHVLDVGSGLGGPARTLAAEFGCHVTGLDLTREFCRAAEMLTARVGLSDKVRFKHGDALDMPFEDNTFDAVWMQFAGMNIQDRQRLYQEVHRVLRPHGVFAIHEVMEGDGSTLYYPAHWANESAISFLYPPHEIHRFLLSSGFRELKWQDITQHAYEMFKAGTTSKPRLGFNLFILDRLPEKVTNALKNLEENKIAVWQGVFQVIK